MITKIEIKNFKKIDHISFNLESTVVLIGPNNSGKTTVLQALMLWKCGIDKIQELQLKKSSKTKRPGAAINRKDLIALPVSTSRFIWRDQSVRVAKKNQKGSENIRIEITVHGDTDGYLWSAPLEFDYSNTETIYCRPLKNEDGTYAIIDDIVFKTQISFLQPMSGISTIEDKLSPGSINSRIGEGKTADVLRNICYQLLYPENELESDLKNWSFLNESIYNKFGARINKPVFNAASGKIEMTYTEGTNILDIASSGRGFQQTLLLLAFVLSSKKNIILLDEPDAHLEVIRQREIYDLLKKFTSENNSQLIIASHSEIVLNEAAENDKVIAIYDNIVDEINEPKERQQFKKLLTDIGWDKYFLAKSRKHILYFEGMSDAKMIKAFAEKLNNTKLLNLIEKANIHYVQNNTPSAAKENFYNLQNLIPNLRGLAIFDKLPNQINETNQKLKILQLKKREMENYFCFPSVLKNWAQGQGNSNLFENLISLMDEAITENTSPANLKNLDSDWWINTKISDEYLPVIFKSFYEKQNRPNKFNKGNYYELIKYMSAEDIDQDILDKLKEIQILLEYSY